MTKFNIRVWRKSYQGKSYPHTIGKAWIDKDGVTRLEFDSLPLADEKGRTNAFLEPRDTKDSAKTSGNGKADLDGDEIPF